MFSPSHASLRLPLLFAGLPNISSISLRPFGVFIRNFLRISLAEVSRNFVALTVLPGAPQLRTGPSLGLSQASDVSFIEDSQTAPVCFRIRPCSPEIDEKCSPLITNIRLILVRCHGTRPVKPDPNKHPKKARESWLKFLNPDSLRTNLLLASLYLSAYEILRNSIMDQIIFVDQRERFIWILG